MHAWTCHWEFISGPHAGGRTARSLVWICEYPYRTIRSGPSDDCEGCRRATRRFGGLPHLDPDVQALEHDLVHSGH